MGKDTDRYREEFGRAVARDRFSKQKKIGLQDLAIDLETIRQQQQVQTEILEKI